ncbi:rhomboid-related protein 3 isoform X6 [Pteropus vampyrus]|uniref:rhomboid protease n=1 Tax=Pteropus vampyrus TaxID=132908 RepID=A0A6P6CH99_PTEVA|nr:rhomboid-related protein 3 isoform X5 [Pteropus vampyrus]XP_023386376.1 rhomboid-related protein 3 isoform X6 [Pteropus vampyrus]
MILSWARSVHGAPSFACIYRTSKPLRARSKLRSYGGDENWESLEGVHLGGPPGAGSQILKMSNKRSNSFRQAILQGNRRLCSKALLEEKGLNFSQRLIRHVAYETLPREIDRKWYYDSYTCCPPPWFMITVTLLEVAFFLYNGVSLDQFVLQVTHPQYLKNSLVYHPQLRAQAWRYLTYIFMHAGIEHLGLNVVLQLLVGVPLEMVHGATRIGLVYVAGVVAGSLAVSVADMTAPVVGSSGGVYALVSAHLANIVMNWSGMKCQFKLLRMAVALICIV